MASSKGIRAGAAYVELGVDDRIAAGLKKAAAKLKAFGASVRNIGFALAGIGTSTLSAFGAASKVFADMGSEIFDASIRTGIAAEQLSALKFAAEQSGASLEELEVAARRMSRAITDAAAGSKTAAAALAQLGLTAKDLEGLSPDKQFLLIAKRLNALKNPTLKSALAMDIFGKSGTRLLPMLTDLDAQLQRAKDLGLIVTTEDAAAADKFGDILGDLWKQAKMVTFHVGAAVGKALQPFLEGAARIGAKVIAWVQANRGLAVTIAAVAAAVAAAGVGFIVLGSVIAGAGVVLGAVAAGVTAMGTALASLVSPIGLVIAALSVGAAAFLAYTETGQSVLQWLADKFGQLAGIVRETINGISDALAAGNIALAAQILWAGVKLAFLNGTAEIRKIFIDGVTGVLAAWEIVQSALSKTWINTVSLIQTAWAAAMLGVQTIWEKTQNVLEKGWLEVMGLFDEGLDVEAAKKMADDDSRRRLNAITAEGAARIANVEAERQARLKMELEQNKRNLENIAGGGQDKKQAVTDEIARLTKELEAARKQAGQERADLGAGPTGTKIPTLDDLTDSLGSVTEKIASRGTFNAAAAQSLQSDPVQERIAKASETTARNTAAIKNGQPAFT